MVDVKSVISCANLQCNAERANAIVTLTAGDLTVVSLNPREVHLSKVINKMKGKMKVLVTRKLYIAELEKVKFFFNHAQ